MDLFFFENMSLTRVSLRGHGPIVFILIKNRLDS
jgi:hypothetical protein